MSLIEFRSKFKVLYEKWGYRFKTNPNYEARTRGDLRPFQHLTDYLMRYLQQGFVMESDVRTMIAVDFYVAGRDFNVSDAALRTYLELCGVFFRENRDTCTSAYAYLSHCEPSSTRCLLQIAFRWAAVVWSYVVKLDKGENINIRDFTETIYVTTLTECKLYIEGVHGIGQNAGNIEEAIQEIQEFDTPYSDPDDPVSEDEVVIDVSNNLQIRL